MKGLKKRRRVQIVLFTVAALVLATGLIGFAFRDGINYFRSPTQVVETPPPASEVFRLGGLVAEGSIVRGQGETVRFAVTDGNETVEVEYTGVLPDLFDENQGMIGTGSMVAGVFQATDILAKHDESYMPKEVLDTLKEQGVYQDPNS